MKMTLGIFPSLLLLLTGILNFSAQIIYQKWSSQYLGDLYSTYIVVYFVFVSGGFLGNFFAKRISDYLPGAEILTGVWAIMLGFVIRYVPISHISYGLCLFLLCIPAIMIGAHLPAYYAWFKNLSKLYALVHFGAFVGCLVIEYLFWFYFSISELFFLIGFIQMILGFCLLRYKSPMEQQFSFKFSSLARLSKRSLFAVFLTSLFSFSYQNWVLRTFTIVTEGWRINVSLLMAAVFFWYSISGLVWGGFKRMGYAKKILIFGALITVHVNFLLAPKFFLPLSLNSAFPYYLFPLYGVSALIALSFPLLLSSLFYVNEIEENLITYKSDVNTVAAFNIVSLLAQITSLIPMLLTSGDFWSKEFLTILMGCWGLAGLFLFSQRTQIIIILLMLSSVIMVEVNQTYLVRLFEKKDPPGVIQFQPLREVKLIPSPFSTVAILSKDSPILNDPTSLPGGSKYYFVDGHTSHILNLHIEEIIGMLSSIYFSDKIPKSISVGLGSGQSSWGLAQVSEKASFIEISPAAIDNLSELRAYNKNFSLLKNIEIILDDGLNYLLKCTPRSYDMILNTATYIANFNASKLYSDEFVTAAKNCLKADGVYQTYFDVTTITTPDEVNLFVNVLKKHFKYVDVLKDPYPFVFAYDEDRKIQIPKILKDHINQYMSHAKCFQISRNVQTSSSDISNIDNGLLEKIGLRNMIEMRYGLPLFHTVQYPSTWKFKCLNLKD